jgi:uncharacterized protein YueI
MHRRRLIGRLTENKVGIFSHFVHIELVDLAERDEQLLVFGAELAQEQRFYILSIKVSEPEML